MKIEIKVPQDKSKRSVAFTPIDDYLLERMILESHDFILSGSRNGDADEISLEIYGNEYKLFAENLSSDNFKNFIPFLFAFQKIEWLHPDWYKSEIIQKLDYFLSNAIDPQQHETRNKSNHLLTKNVIGKTRDQDSTFKDLDSNKKRLNVGKEAIEFELRKQEKELKKYLLSKNKISVYEELKKNLSKLKKETGVYEDQLEQINQDLDELIKFKEPLVNEEEKYQVMMEEKSKLLEQFQSMSHNEKFARSQMVELDKELSVTNNQGIEYITKLESLEKTIFDIDQSLGQINDSRIPGHVIKKINEYNDILREYLMQLSKLEFIHQQIEEFEDSIKNLKGQQNAIGQANDLSEKINSLDRNIIDIDKELERLKGREESLIEGEKLLSNSICPIIEKTCTTIDEPVEDFFKRKLAVVSVDRSKLIQKKENLTKQISNKKRDQELYLQWNGLQTKIFHTMDILMEAFSDFNKEEKILNHLPIGQEALIVIGLLENLFPIEIIGNFQKTFLRIGKAVSSPDLKLRVQTYQENITDFEKEWKIVFSYFRDIVKKVDLEDDQLLHKREQHFSQKTQMRKEYSIICQQVESIEKRRKDLSKLLFEAGKVNKVSEQLEDLKSQIEKTATDVKRYNESVAKEKELKYKKEFLEGYLETIQTTEKKYKNELKEMKKDLNLEDKEKLDENIAFLNRKNEALKSEIKIIENRIKNIELQKKDMLFLEKNMTISRITRNPESMNTENNSSSNYAQAPTLNINLQTIIDEIQFKTALVISEYKRRFPSPMPETASNSLEKITKIQFLMRYCIGNTLLPLAVVTNSEDLFWWHEFSKNNFSVMLVGSKSLKKQAKIYS